MTPTAPTTVPAPQSGAQPTAHLVDEAAGPGPWAPAPGPKSVSNAKSIVAMILGLFAVVLFPPVLGAIGITLGVLAKREGEPLATWGIVVPAVGLVAGAALGILVVAALA